MDSQLSLLYVVLIEPSPAQSKVVMRQFDILGIHHYRHFADPVEALDSIFDDVPDLVISSLHIGEVDGKDVVLRLRDNPATANTPFMLISTTTSFRDLDPIRQAGASAVLPKPFCADDLRVAVRNTIGWEDPGRVQLEDMDTESLAVLIVDDSALARRMIARTLKKMGFEKITEADDGAAAIPLLRENHYDLVVTDYNMPCVDGHELLRYIRNESMQSSVPVLMVTTEHDASKLAAIEQAGVSAIFDKPFEAALVKQTIESALAHY